MVTTLSTAAELGYIYVDTGAMYRALALYCTEENKNLDDEEEISKALDGANVSLAYEDEAMHTYLNGEDVSVKIRREEIGNAASVISAYPAVRKKLLFMQRDLAKENDCIMDGRDIGSFVLPDARVKIYLSASVETRAKRRYDELVAKGEKPSITKIEKDISDRDRQDKSRKIAPLIQAEDAVYVDSSNLTIEEVISRIKEIAKEKQAI